MSLKSQFVKEIEITSDCDAFLDLLCHKPHELPKICSSVILGCELQKGEWGTAGSVITWNYIHDGVESSVKHIVEPDIANKKIKFTVIEGDVMKLYKTITITGHVDKLGESNLVTWTFEYEKMSEDIPDPDYFMDLLTKVTTDMETHLLP